MPPSQAQWLTVAYTGKVWMINGYTHLIRKVYNPLIRCFCSGMYQFCSRISSTTSIALMTTARKIQCLLQTLNDIVNQTEYTIVSSVFSLLIVTVQLMSKSK
jgi:hypothetical protein